MQLVEAYFDESGSDDGSEVLCVAGYIFEKDARVELDSRWQEVLKNYGLPFFRMSACAHGVEPFDALTLNQRIEVEKEMIALIKKYSAYGVGGWRILPQETFPEWRPSRSSMLHFPPRFPFFDSEGSMRQVVLLGLLVLMTNVPSASAQAHLMNKTEFYLFLHDLERDSDRWMDTVSEVDVSSLKDLPYRKGELMDKAKVSIRESLLTVRNDVRTLRKNVTLTAQIDLLMDLEGLETSMSDVGYNLDYENAGDSDKYLRWTSDVEKAIQEITDSNLKLYGHLRELSLRIDRQIDVNKIH